MMKVLVTGANGFLGANICRRLLKANHDVYAVCQKTTGWRLHGIRKQIQPVIADISYKPKISHALQTIKPDAIIHMAAYGAYPLLQKDMQRMLMVNYVGLSNILDSYNKYEVMINAGSSSQYGHCEQPMGENDRCMPMDYYGASKLAAEELCQTHTRRTGAPIINTRLFSAYGPYEEATRLVPSTIIKCIDGKQIKLTSGMQCRDFIHTPDIENAYMSLLKRPYLAGETFNIGTGQEHSVRTIVRAIHTETRSASLLEWGTVPDRENNPPHWRANPDKSGRVFGWEAKTNLKDGIRETVKWMKRHRKEYPTTAQEAWGL